MHDYLQYYRTLDTVSSLIGYRLKNWDTESGEELRKKLEDYQGYLDKAYNDMREKIQPRVESLVKEYIRLKLEELKPFIREFFGAQINSASFTYETGANSQREEVTNFINGAKISSRKSILGWCDGTSVNPPKEGIAVMFEDNETFEKTWFHFPLSGIDAVRCAAE